MGHPVPPTGLPFADAVPAGGETALRWSLAEVAGEVVSKLGLPGLVVSEFASAPGTVSGHSNEPGLDYAYRDLAGYIQITVAGPDGQSSLLATLMVKAGHLVDEDGSRAGSLNPDGTVSLDKSWVESLADAEEQTRCRRTPGAPFGQRGLDMPLALQTNSFAARHGAFKDPILERAGLTERNKDQPNCAEWQAHHLIPLAQVKDHQSLFVAAAAAGWHMDEAANLIGLPSNQKAQELLTAAGSPLPLHDNNHQEGYSAAVEERLLDVERRLAGLKLPKGSEEYNQAAKRLVEGLEVDERASIKHMGAVRLTMSETPVRLAEADQAATHPAAPTATRNAHDEGSSTGTAEPSTARRSQVRVADATPPDHDAHGLAAAERTGRHCAALSQAGVSDAQVRPGQRPREEPADHPTAAGHASGPPQSAMAKLAEALRTGNEKALAEVARGYMQTAGGRAWRAGDEALYQQQQQSAEVQRTGSVRRLSV